MSRTWTDTTYEVPADQSIVVTPHHDQVAFHLAGFVPGGGFCIHLLPVEEHIQSIRQLLGELVTLRDQQRFELTAEDTQGDRVVVDPSRREVVSYEGSEELARRALDGDEDDGLGRKSDA